MDLSVSASPPLRGEWTLPGDKSLSHRAALFAALAEGESRIENFLVSGVTRSMLTPLTALGVPWSLSGATLTVAGRGWQGLQPPQETLYCGNSGTTLRMLAGALAAAGIEACLDGSDGLRRRPMKRIVEPLQAMGAPIEAMPGGYAPLRLAARPPDRQLRGLTHRLSVASAQVKTALLLAALAADAPTTVIEPAHSRDHTERMLASMGVQLDVHTSGERGELPSVTLHPPSEPLQPLHWVLPGDISSAAFLIVAALITPGSQLVLREVGVNPTRTGLLDALWAMGADIRVEDRGLRQGEPVGDLTVRFSALRGTQVHGPLVVRMIDEFPIFAVAAACAEGPTSVGDAGELRYKESDRIAALCQTLGALGVVIRETPAGFELAGNTPPMGGAVSSFGDHRLAMALTVAGLVAGAPVCVQAAEMMAESFPGFVESLRSLGAPLVVAP